MAGSKVFEILFFLFFRYERILSDHVVFHGVFHNTSRIFYVQLHENLFAMRFYGIDADEELFADLLAAQPVADQLQYFHFSFGKAFYLMSLVNLLVA